MGKTLSGALVARLAEGLHELGTPPAVEAAETPDTGTTGSATPEARPALPQTGQDAAPVRADQEPPVTETAAPAPAQAPAPDPVLLAAVELAREAAREAGGSAVGDHLGVELEADAVDGPVLTHAFATTDRAYVGWRWTVTVARAEGTEHVTVDEVVLLPGTGALVAPSWLPWNERLQAGDLAPGDLLPPAPDDERLVPAHADDSPEDTALADEASWELGLGRPRVLSREGRLDAAERWWSGDAGPDSPIAKQAPGHCVDCGFLVPLAGGLRQAFGVCANAVAPDDGRVVALAHGCGAHSETVVEPQHAATAGMAVEDDEFELLPTGAPAPEADAP